MLKTKTLFLLFIILSIIFYLSLSYSFKLFNYSTILVKFEKYDIIHNESLKEKWLSHFENEVNSVGIDTKKSSFIVFKNIQKWDIVNDIILWEIIFEKNYKRIIKLLNNEIDINKNSYLFMQFFSTNTKEFLQKLEVIENKMLSTNLYLKNDCVAMEKYFKHYEKKHNNLEFTGNAQLFFKDILTSRVKELENSMNISCLNVEYEIFDSKTIQKYNIFFLSFLISLSLTLFYFFIGTVFDAYKKR